MTFSVGQKISPEQAMDLALTVAELGKGFVLPNPAVGCVIVDKNHCFLAAGAHRTFGLKHAEIDALDQVKDPVQLQGATLYVTLEPCSHHGKTPPCVDAIIRAGVGHVVYGIEDPFPQVAGRGLATLMENDVEVGHFQTFQPRCEALVRDFLHLQKSAFPFVILKVAASLDGQIATTEGESQWITGPETRAYGRLLRGQSCATMIGAGTFLNDDPLLDFRDTPFEGKKKNRIVLLDPRGKAVDFFAKSRLARSHSKDRILVITREQWRSKWAAHGVRVLPFSSKKEAWEENLVKIRQWGVYSLYVEGGSFAIGQFLKHRLFQRLYYFLGPKIIGDGLSWSKALKLSSLNQALNLVDTHTQKLGEDLLITAEFSA